MKNNYPEFMLNAISADIVAETSAGTYLGWYDRQKYDPAGSDVTEQQIWKIKFFKNETANGEKITKTLYPNGNKHHSFAWNDHSTLTYQYAK